LGEMKNEEDKEKEEGKSRRGTKEGDEILG
jgi:hypothetical protein